ncbi:hypothetical protein ACJD0Z_07775 [Flavobacteriaceae bacterium M23B6Z8]
MNSKNKILVAALIANSLFTGSLLVIWIALLPFWGSLEETALMNWFSAHFHRLLLLLTPLNLLTITTILFGFLKHRKQTGTVRSLWMFALLGIFLCTITYPLFFYNANKLLAGSGRSQVNILEVLDSWERWHIARTIMSGLSLLTLIRISFEKE